jgi:hypothetical protein
MVVGFVGKWGRPSFLYKQAIERERETHWYSWRGIWTMLSLNRCGLERWQAIDAVIITTVIVWSASLDCNVRISWRQTQKAFPRKFFVGSQDL